MKILIISNLYPPHILGGYEILCEQVVNHLEQRGHTLQVLTSSHESAEGNTRVKRSLQLYIPFSEPAAFNRMARIKTERFNRQKTASVIGELKPDIIFIWSILRLTPGPARAAEQSGIPTLYTFNDEHMAGYAPTRFSLSPKTGVKWFLDRFIHPRITFRGLQFPFSTCISKQLKKNMTAKNVPIENAQVIYQGIPVENFPVKEHAGVMQKPLQLIYAGQLHHYKGVHTILEALYELEQENGLPDFSLDIAGTGPEEYISRLQELARKITARVRFLGRLPHDSMGTVYREHDMFIFPSIWEEPFGLTHLEAMSSGLAVLSTANGGQGEFLEDGINTLVFPPGDAAALARGLKKITGDRKLFAALVKNGRHTAITDFNFTRYVDEIEELLITAEKSR